MKTTILCYVLLAAVVVQAIPRSAISKTRLRRNAGIDEDMLMELEKILEQELDKLEGELDERQETQQQQEQITVERYGPPPEGWNAGLSTSQAMRAFSRASKRTQEMIAERLEREEQFTRSLENITDDAEIVRRVLDLGMSARASPHPLCSNPVSCNDRVMIDGNEYRKADGSCNNIANPSWGMAGVQHIRWADPIYSNNKWRFVSVGGSGATLANPRTISNRVHSVNTSTVTTNSQGISQVMFAFLQFLDHDLILTPEGGNRRRNCCGGNQRIRGFCMPLVVPGGDGHFNDGFCMDARRSHTVLKECTGTALQNQVNDLTAYIDGSNVYGSSHEEQDNLRTKIGGLLKTSTLNFLPEAKGEDELPCVENGTNGYFCYIAGDIRVNVVATLAGMHTLFVREHNRVARVLAQLHPTWTDEQIFQTARKIVIAELQAVIYNEVLPIIMHSGELATYGVSANYTYNATLDASILSEFGLAFRFGHTLIVESFPETFTGEPEEDRLLKYKFLKSSSVLFKNNYNYFDNLTDAVIKNKCRVPDHTVSNSTRNELFFNGTHSFDLAALNIARSRDWGTDFFAKYVELCLGQTVTTMADLIGLTHTAEMVNLLSQVIASPQDMDLFTGIVTETKVGNSFLGKIGSCIIGKQFQRLKFGDRFFYQTSDSTVGFTTAQLAEIEKVTLAGIICKNTNLESVPRNVFKTGVQIGNCNRYNNPLNFVDLSKWA